MNQTNPSVADAGNVNYVYSEPTYWGGHTSITTTQPIIKSSIVLENIEVSYETMKELADLAFSGNISISLEGVTVKDEPVNIGTKQPIAINDEHADPLDEVATAPDTIDPETNTDGLVTENVSKDTETYRFEAKIKRGIDDESTILNLRIKVAELEQRLEEQSKLVPNQPDPLEAVIESVETIDEPVKSWLSDKAITMNIAKLDYTPLSIFEQAQLEQFEKEESILNESNLNRMKRERLERLKQKYKTKTNL